MTPHRGRSATLASWMLFSVIGRKLLEWIGLPLLDNRVMGVLASGSQELNVDGGDAMILDEETASGSPDKNTEGGPARSKDATGQNGYSVCGIDCLPTPELIKVTEALKTSSADLLMMVQDPLPDAVTAATEVASRLGGGNRPDKRNGVNDVQVSSMIGGGNKSDDPNGVTAAEVASRLGWQNKPVEPTGNQIQVDGSAGIHGCRLNIEVGCAECSYTRAADNKYCIVEMLSNLDDSPTSDRKESDENQDVVNEVAQKQSVREGVDATLKESTGTSVVAPAQFVCKGADTTHKEVTSATMREVAPARTVREGGDATHEEGSRTAAEQNKASIRPRTRLMDRNPTACTLQWGDDSIESSSSNPLKRIRLPSPTRRFVSHFNVAEDITCRKRRKNKRWSVLEEDTLRKAVERHGAGKWKFIRSAYPEIFQDRTEVDLKDKWRNMTRH